MSEQEINIILELIDREIGNFESVRDRVGKKQYWQDRIDRLISIRKSFEAVPSTPDKLLEDFMFKLDYSYEYKTKNERELIKSELQKYGNSRALDTLEEVSDEFERLKTESTTLRDSIYLDGVLAVLDGFKSKCK